MNTHNILLSLASQEVPLRDDQWEKDFLALLPEARFHILNESPIEGPDGWPYLMTAITENPDMGEPALNVIGWLSERGVGLAINPQKETPDYVLTYGMIWNYRQRREFLSTTENAPQVGQVKFEANEKVMAGNASEDYLPIYARSILREFFKGNQIEKPRVLVMSRDAKNFDLCFSLESLGSPEAVEHKNILEAISWFLPAHYNLMLVSEKGLPQFYDL